MRNLQLAVPASVPAVGMLRALADQLETMHQVAVVNVTTPRIGARWAGQDGTYAGMMRGLDGAADYPLIVGDHFQKAMKWKQALEWAEKVGNGWRVLTPAEGWLCQANVPELFGKVWHWTNKEYEADSDCAYAQYFGDGGQRYHHKGNEFAVRLVRSVIVIE